MDPGDVFLDFFVLLSVGMAASPEAEAALAIAWYNFIMTRQELCRNCL
jgi:hypothetical protein